MSERNDRLAGVSAMSLYLPAPRVDLESWCGWTGNSWPKIQAVVGHSFRVPDRDENVYTMAATAVLRLIRQNDVDPREVGFLGLGTESSTDNAAGAVIVRGMVDRALDELALPRLSRHLEVPEFKHACLGGIYALKGACRYVAADGAGRRAIVVSADIAEYERGSSGEQTQGAGAVAMLVDATPQLFEVDLRHAGSASDYRGPDFRKPFARHFRDDYPGRRKRLADFPIFSGRYSTFAYLDETVHAVEMMLERLGVSAGTFYEQDVKHLFFHRPYNMMPIQAMSVLYVRGMARGDHRHGELRELCADAGVAYEDVLGECASAPDLFSAVLESEEPNDPYPATTAIAGLVRRSARFRELLDRKMSLGSKTVMDFGNLYSAALPAWIAAGLEQAATKGLDLAGSPMVVVGYGSGDAAEAIPIRPVAGWERAAARIGVTRALENHLDLSRPQYEALHDGEHQAPFDYPRRDAFAVSRVGKRYDAGFQDLAVEYYSFLR